MIRETLSKIGLSSKEILVYLTGLSLGSQPASVIAKHSKLNRVTVYDQIEKLMEKGLMTCIERDKTTYFQVLDPENLVDWLEREKREQVKQIESFQREVKDIIPVLQSLENPLSSRPKVQFFEGEKGMQEAYDRTLDATEPIRAYANVDEMHKGLPNFFPEYYKRRSDAGIFIRAIFPDFGLNRLRHSLDKQESRESLLIPKKYTFSPEVNVFDDILLIASWKEKMAITIQSAEIAELFKKMFDLLWEELKRK